MNTKAVAVLVVLAVLLSACASAEVLRLDTGKWRLWCDTKAEWRHDRLYLPGEFKLSDLPVNPPTIGWDRLLESGMQVSLPSTVEEHFWGRFGKRDYMDDEYYFGNDDKQPKNGNYLGVSWWWTTFRAPRDVSGKLVFLNFDGVRLRAEVFLNRQLVGYDLIGETPFSVDVTGRIKPGAENLLAVRITNPGGRLDWLDGGTFKWGDYDVPISHAFGGINRGVTLELRPPVYVGSVFVMNRPDPRSVTVRCEINNTTGRSVSALVDVVVKGTDVRKTARVEAAPGITTADIDLRAPDARLWSVDQPNLYTCRATLECDKWTDARDTAFGFRYLDVRGVGRDARFLWNGRRIVLRSAISWGYWGINGLWPGEAMARREIESAKRLGLNCINFHRCIGKPLTLDTQDRLGLLRYEEPGSGGCILSEHEFAAEYTRHKLLRMVTRDRNHPCLAIYCIQNEDDIDPNDPRVERILTSMHLIDPTRPVVFKSGTGPSNEALYLPYEDRMRKDDGTGYCGWWDMHTVGGPGIYRDNLYEGPDKWSHRSDNRKEIVFWGEMLGVGTPDNLQVVRDFYRKTGRAGYDRDDNSEQYAAFDDFLDKRGFRRAFPTVGDLTRSIANKACYFWGRLLENGRISDANDCMVISGWESNPIENHAGVVDCHRYLKGDPALVSYYCRPLHLAVKSRRLVLETGETLVTDLHLVNETGTAGDAEASLTVISPDGCVLDRWSRPIMITGGEVYGQILAVGIETKCYAAPGYYTLKAALTQGGRVLVDGQEKVFVANNTLPAVADKGAIRDYGGVAKSFLSGRGLDLPDYFDDLDKLDYIILAGSRDAGVHGGTQRTDQPIANTEDSVLYQAQVEGPPEEFRATIIDIPNGRYHVMLKFAELVCDGPGQRVFDIAINGRTVIKDLDIFAESGGGFRALDRTVEVDVTDHALRITTPGARAGLAVLCAFSVSGQGVAIAVNCQGPAYTDGSGKAWSGNWRPEVLPGDILKRVRDDGASLILWTTGADSAREMVEEMDRAGVLKYRGSVGSGRTSWMGAWTAVREHPLLNGLPVNTALNWEYQADGSDGLIVDGDGVEWVSAFGRDHDRNIGTSLFTVPCGRGEIIVNCLADPYYGLKPGREGLAVPVVRRILFNAIEYAVRKR